jgi:hypothetical protein
MSADIFYRLNSHIIFVINQDVLPICEILDDCNLFGVLSCSIFKKFNISNIFVPISWFKP